MWERPTVCNGGKGFTYKQNIFFPKSRLTCQRCSSPVCAVIVYTEVFLWKQCLCLSLWSLNTLSDSLGQPSAPSYYFFVVVVSYNIQDVCHTKVKQSIHGFPNIPSAQHITTWLKTLMLSQSLFVQSERTWAQSESLSFGLFSAGVGCRIPVVCRAYVDFLHTILWTSEGISKKNVLWIVKDYVLDVFPIVYQETSNRKSPLHGDRGNDAARDHVGQPRVISLCGFLFLNLHRHLPISSLFSLSPTVFGHLRPLLDASSRWCIIVAEDVCLRLLEAAV